jgi:hypothetical protein
VIRHRTIPLVAAAIIAAGLAGCGIDDPYADNGTTTPTTATEDQHTDEAPPLDTTTGATTPPLPELDRRDERIRVAVDFAVTQATWTGDTWLKQQERMKALASGRALRDLEHVDVPLADQAQVIADSKLTSRASFLAADIRKGRDSPTEATVIVVLKVQAGGAGRKDDVPDYTVNQATVSKVDGEWRVTNYVTLP